MIPATPLIPQQNPSSRHEIEVSERDTVPGYPDAWQVTWLPGQLISRSGAVTAMVLADAASRDLPPDHRLWPHISGWAAELGLTAPVAVALASEPPREKTTDREPAASPPDREATGP